MLSIIKLLGYQILLPPYMQNGGMNINYKGKCLINLILQEKVSFYT